MCTYFIYQRKILFKCGTDRGIRMNIIFLIGKLRFSGAENVLRCLATEIAKRGHKVEILLRDNEVNNEELPGVRIAYCGADGNPIQRRLGRKRNIRIEVNRFKADLVVGFGFPMNFDAVMGVRGTGAKSIICERMDPYTCSKNFKFEIQRKLYYRLADGYVVQTPRIQEFYKIHYAAKKNVAVIPNPVRRSAYHIQNSENSEEYLVTVGRLDDAQKNQSMLINAFAQISPKYPKLRLKIAGSGQDQNKYEELIRNLKIESKVDLLGNIPDPMDVIHNAKIFLLTSNHEGMPNALIEAMSQGKACISTRCSGGGAEYLIQNGENGILIDCGDVDGCSVAIETLLNDPGKREVMGKRALSINQKLDVDVITDQWIEYFSEICNSSKPISEKGTK